MIPLLAFLLGVKHSYDADHILAVSNLLTRTKSLRTTILMSVSWAMGHMLTATVVTVFLYHFKESILSALLSQFDLVVGVMLILLGASALKDVSFFHKHMHSHGGDGHIHHHTHLKGQSDIHHHRHMFGIGIVHGLASNDELITLFTLSLSLTTLFGMLLGIAVFSIGVVIGMIGYGIMLNHPFRRFLREKAQNAFKLSAGLLSIVYGVFMIATL